MEVGNNNLTIIYIRMIQILYHILQLWSHNRILKTVTIIMIDDMAKYGIKYIEKFVPERYQGQYFD